MSAGILRALMQLFAIISGSGQKSGREIVALFLRQQLNKEMVNNYLKLYEEFAEKFHNVKDSEKKTEAEIPLCISLPILLLSRF